MKHLTSILARNHAPVTPQSEPIRGTAPNSAGGFSFPVDNWTRFRRFLILGSEGGSYYASQRALTTQNLTAIFACLDENGARVVREIVEISVAGRAPKNDAALFALAIAASCDNDATRKLALDALPQVARTGTHLFHFAAFVDAQRGWGRGLRAAIARWYGEKSGRDLAFQLLKYQARDGWSHRDLLRLCHAKAASETQNIAFGWATRGWPSVGEAPHPNPDLVQIWAFERIKRAQSEVEAANLIRDYELPREAVPTQFLTSVSVWEALLERMPLGATVRNLATMTKIGLLTPKSDATQTVLAALRDENRVRRARLHPIAILSALRTYVGGHGVRGNATWMPVGAISDALDGAFYAAFGGVEATGKRFLLALDVSGSMDCGAVAGVPGLSPRAASAAMALVTNAVEDDVQIVGFTSAVSGFGGLWGGGTSGLTPIGLSRKTRLDHAVKTVSRLPMGGTDCALPMTWALENREKFDVFVVYTDSETWAGRIHPVQALRQYREKTGIAAKLVVVGMVSNGFSIADPNDAGMLDVVGFDTATPQLMSEFALGAV